MLVIPSEQVETLYRNLNRFRLSLHRVPILVGEYEHASELEVIPAKGRLRVLIKACGRSIILELGTPGYKNPLKSINLDTTILENIILDLALILTVRRTFAIPSN